MYRYLLLLLLWTRIKDYCHAFVGGKTGVTMWCSFLKDFEILCSHCHGNFGYCRDYGAARTGVQHFSAYVLFIIGDLT